MIKPLFLIVLLVSSESATTQRTMSQRKPKNEDVKSVGQRPASDAHSFMELFGKLERDWGMAAERKDREALDGFLAEEFIERDAADPKHTITKIEWMEKHLPAYNLDPLGITAMTVRAFLRNAVVSFVQSQKPDAASARPVPHYLIVDVWVVNHQKWQLASRFTSPVLGATSSSYP